MYIPVFLQVNYLIDEAFSVGKGANSIIFMLHHFLHHHGFGETNLHLHADNCCGQNKNRFMMQYLMWRVLAGLNDEIKMSFLPVGHTKFSPDWCFGLFKRLFRRTKIGSLNDIAAVVEQSATVNHPQLVGSQDGTIIVPFYNWSEFFDPYMAQTALKGISQMHHFRFSALNPGIVYVKNSCNDKEKPVKLLKTPWQPTLANMPNAIPPPGLTLERQWYLYNKIREFCPEEAKDIVCPKPSTPLPQQ